MARAKTIPSRLRPRKSVIGMIVVIALITLAWSGWAWWHYVRSNPQRVFNAMLENSLKTTGIADHLLASNGSTQLDQTIQLRTTPLHLAHSHTTISQSGPNSASVTTETIGTSEADYLRYLDVKELNNGSAKPFDYSQVANLWGKTTSSKDIDPNVTSGDLYDQTILAVVPLGNLPLEGRRQLLEQMRRDEVYTPDYATVKQAIRNGRPEYVYNVSIKADAYVSMLKNFARQLGYTHLEAADPADYAGGKPIKVTLTVDVWSRRLIRIDYDGGTRAETFSGFGGQFRIPPVPENTIPIEELKMRVQSLQ